MTEPATPGPDGRYEPYAARCADALVELASQRLTDDQDGDRACVVVHVPAGALVEGGTEPGAEIADGIPIPNEVARRIACDAYWQPALDRYERTIATSRRKRTIPASLRRAIRRRDRHCRFPGCDRRRGLQIHHMVHYADGGPTESWNLVSLCPYHHRFLHEHGWTVTGDPEQPEGLVFRAPDGRRLGGPRPRLRPEIRARVLQPA